MRPEPLKGMTEMEQGKTAKQKTLTPYKRYQMIKRRMDLANQLILIEKEIKELDDVLIFELLPPEIRLKATLNGTTSILMARYIFIMQLISMGPPKNTMPKKLDGKKVMRNFARTMLHMGFIANCSNGDTKYAESMIMGNAIDSNICDASGMTGLMWAARNGFVETVEMLLKHGANTDLTDLEGNSALSWAADNKEIIKILKQYGAKE